MIHSWIARLVMVAALASVAWCGEGSALARTAEERFPIVVDADGVPHLPVSAVAGPTRVTLDNLTTASFGVSLYLIPPAVANRIASVTPTADGADTADGTHVPDWLGETTPIGGPGIAGPDGRTEAVVDLLPGTYVLVFDFFPPQAGTLTSVVLNYADGSPFLVTVQDLPEPTQTPRPTRTPSPRATRTPSQVTPDNPLATSEPEAEPTEEDDASEEPTGGAGSSEETSTVVMTDDGFLLPAAFPIGLQTWEVVNQGQQPHALIVVAVPAGTTADQLRVALFPSPGEAVAASFDTSAMVNVGGLGPLAPGLSADATLDLPSGTYAVFSALPDPTTGEPDGARGLLAIFVIG